MKFFLDTGNIEEIKRVNRLGILDGITTNPTLIAKEGRTFKEIIIEICNEVNGPVSAEVVGETADKMVEEAHELASWASNVVVKVPMTEAGLEATHRLYKEGIKTNVTLVFSVAQGLMAAKAGATYISPFVGRLDDTGIDGMQLVGDLRAVLDNYDMKTEIIAASIRNITHLQDAAIMGSHIATVPGKLLPDLWKHPLTDIGIERFLKDWEKVPK